MASRHDGRGATHYARVESSHVLTSDLGDLVLPVLSPASTTDPIILIRFSTVRAQWNGFRQGTFALAANDSDDLTITTPAEAYWRTLFESPRSKPLPDELSDMPTETLLFSVSKKDINGLDLDALEEAGAWLDLYVERLDYPMVTPLQATSGLTRGLILVDGPMDLAGDGTSDDEPTAVFTLGRPLELSAASQALDRSLSMRTWPLANPTALTTALGRLSQLSQMVALDVGQAMCVALLGTDGIARAYVDVGTPLTFLKEPVPASDYCLCLDPLIVLTHWHADHYQGGWTKNRDLLQRTWLAPRQPNAGPGAIRYAHSIVRAGGKLLLVDKHTPGTISARVAGRVAGPFGGRLQQIELSVCTGNKINDSGLAVWVSDLDRRLNWLLPGDADYQFIPAAAEPFELAAFTVAHHGGELTHSPPIRSAQAYGRALYSYGPNNTYRHARATTSGLHHAQGWNDFATTVLGGMNEPAGRDVLKTASHVNLNLGPVAAGWRQRPYTPRHFTACANVPAPLR